MIGKTCNFAFSQILNVIKIRKILNMLIWVVLGIFLSAIILAHTPSVQSLVGKKIGKSISERIGAEVKVGRVDLGLFNRFIIDDVIIYDKLHVDMLKVGRISVKIDILDLAYDRITITSAQLFALQTNFYKLSPTLPPNFQFALDSLTTEKSDKQNSVDLSIKSLVIRNGQLVYDEKYIKETKHFSLSHVNIRKLSTHIMLNKLSPDSINLFVQKLSCIDHSGLEIKHMSFAFIADKNNATLNEFMLKGIKSIIKIPQVTFSYVKNKQDVIPTNLQYKGASSGVLIPSDFSFLLSELKNLAIPVTFNINFSGTDNFFNLDKLILKQRNSVNIEGSGIVCNRDSTPYWNATINKSKIDSKCIIYYLSNLLPKYHLPAFLNKLGNVALNGKFKGKKNGIFVEGNLGSNVGNVDINGKIIDKHFFGSLTTNKLNIGTIVDKKIFGKLDSKLDLKGYLDNGKYIFSIVRWDITNFTYNGYQYSNIYLNYKSDSQSQNANVNITDPNVCVCANVNLERTAIPVLSLEAKVNSLDLYRLNLSKEMKGSNINFEIAANIKGNELNNIVGKVDVKNLTVNGGKKDYHLSKLAIDASQDKNNHKHVLTIDSDFGYVNITGRYNYATIVQSLTNIIGNRLPTLPGLPKMNNSINNDFQITANITKSDWLNALWNIPLQLNRPLTLDGRIHDSNRQIELTLNIPSFKYGANSYKQGYLRLTTPSEALELFCHLHQVGKNTKGTYWNIQSKANNNKLYTLLSFENNGKNNFAGVINTETNFLQNKYGMATADINVRPSDILIGDSVWHVKPSNINYYKDHLTIDNLSVEHNSQHIMINGNATRNPFDTLRIDLHDVDISYILNFLNFHSVEFAGKATGIANITSLFSKPDMQGDIWVQDFKFEDGRMGILSANVALNHISDKLQIEATAYDEGNSRTIINGYVSPQQNYIDLRIKAQNTRGEFLESLCSSFMKDADLKVNGNVRVFGNLSNLNLEGDAVVNGSIGIKPLNTYYTLQSCSVKLIPDEIKLSNCSFIDRNGNSGNANGSIYHKHLTQISYDITTNANNLLAYDFKSYGDQTFYGTVFATGDCRVKGKNGEVIIDAHATPQKGSFIEYNASSPETFNKQSFIHWNSIDTIGKTKATNQHSDALPQNDIDIPSDIHLNLHINCTPEATLRVLMDKQSGDYIALTGNGAIRAAYFNKGDFDMYGTYEVTGGVYRLTVQNILRRDFQFLSGGTIVFGGNAMDAILKLKAQYTINGVSLSDLNIGKSFTSNNIRVNCLMNITGTPLRPKVDFGLDLPTINNEAKQMVTQLINSEEGMNQQVLYLLAVGRFYSQSNNSNSTLVSQQQNRTSLAMQSILSGTISQQLNTILSSVTKNENWNFGANISTGDEGWNNAEYEGLLSGRMFNNRLLFNGQFGYRDKANATTSFIGDFDLQYLIYPNGNLSVRVYNQTNDRYFTKNSLNTQGLGIVLKKDFNGWRDLLGIKSRKSKAKKRRKIL